MGVALWEKNGTKYKPLDESGIRQKKFGPKCYTSKKKKKNTRVLSNDF